MHVLFLMMIATAIMGAAGAASPGPSQNPVAGQSGGQIHLPAYQQHNEQQPQGPTDPLDTTTGGAPAESPQGQSPPGMQAAPEGSSKSIIDNK
jgi:hypothetical protein